MHREIHAYVVLFKKVWYLSTFSLSEGWNLWHSSFPVRKKKTSKNFSLLLKEHNSSKVSLQFLCWCRSWRSQARKVHNGKVKSARLALASIKLELQNMKGNGAKWDLEIGNLVTYEAKEMNDIAITPEIHYVLLGNAVLEWDFSIVESQGKLATDTKSKAYSRIENGKTRKPCLLNQDWKKSRMHLRVTWFLKIQLCYALHFKNFKVIQEFQSISKYVKNRKVFQDFKSTSRSWTKKYF